MLYLATNMTRLKTCFVVLLITGCFAVSSGQQVKFITNGNLRTAFNLAKAQHKKVFLEWYQEGCHTCELYDPLFKNPAVAKYYNDHFICYRLNAYAAETQAFLQVQKINLSATPTFLFFTADVKLLYYEALSEQQNTAAVVLQVARKALASQPKNIPQ